MDADPASTNMPGGGERPGGDVTGDEMPGGDLTGGMDGGDAVCWLERVCDSCGALADGPPAAVCERCGTPRNDPQA